MGSKKTPEGSRQMKGSLREPGKSAGKREKEPSSPRVLKTGKKTALELSFAGKKTATWGEKLFWDQLDSGGEDAREDLGLIGDQSAFPWCFQLEKKMCFLGRTGVNLPTKSKPGKPFPDRF